MAGGVIPLYSAGQLVFTHTYIYGIIHLLKHTESCVQQKKSIALLLASVTSEQWFCGVHMRSQSCVKTPCFQGLYASKQLQKNRTLSYDSETTNRRSGTKGRGFESCHFDYIITGFLKQTG